MIHIDDIIVVEGKDDIAAVKRAVDCEIIATHGFGYGKRLLKILEEASKRKNLIIFTDSDYMGSQIRKDLARHFPKAKHAYLSQEKSNRDGDIGVENASPKDILEALKNARAQKSEKKISYNLYDLRDNNLIDGENSSERRKKFCDILSIGYGNGKSLLNKLNAYDISRDEFQKALDKIIKDENNG
ncbi:ribonuclease M5 [Peptoniphilus raoultii]|uniref:ribonuclease M5 n=1 Tax=Peptoniphilus raoultii TaxID=1776387 RepID=UPI0008DAC6F6|nr:ribonuclease M5 [Peptoniphilus raoultii]